MVNCDPADELDAESTIELKVFMTKLSQYREIQVEEEKSNTELE